MIRRLLKEESGYSMVEVIVSMFILTAAIIPMVGMFDMGLKSASKGGNYDGARALSNASLEKVRALPYADAQTAYRPVNDTPTAGTPVSCDSGIYDCEVTTSYVDADDFESDPLSNTMLVTVTVEWEANNNFTATGLIAK